MKFITKHKETIISNVLVLGICIAGHYALNKYENAKMISENVERWQRKFEVT